MKKTKIKLSLNKENVSNLMTDAIKGGVTGKTCRFTNMYYNTCEFITCFGCDDTEMFCIPNSVTNCNPTVKMTHLPSCFIC